MTVESSAVTPRIYVASLADYNAGRLHGCWIDADQPEDSIREEIAKLLAASSEPVAEDWAIHDYEHFGGLRLSEFEDIERVAEAARLIVEHGEVFPALVEHFGGLSGLDEAKTYMEDAYCGEYEDVGCYAYDIAHDLYHDEMRALPEFIGNHIDWEGVGEELEMAGDIFTVQVGRQVHVFDAHL